MTNPLPQGQAAMNAFGRKDYVTSHSSFLTNDRIDVILRNMDNWKVLSWQTPTVINISKYFSNLYNFYDNVFMILREEAQTFIQGKFREYFRAWFLMLERQEGEAKDNLMRNYKLLILLDIINYEIKADLQRGQYFFRTEERDIKRIEDGLKKLKEGGGLFGGISGLS